ALRNFRLLAEVDQLAIDPIARRPPLLLHQQRPSSERDPGIRRVQPIQFRRRRLNQRRQRNRLLDAHRNIANSKLERVKEWMRPDVPPDFFRVIDAVSLDQKLDVAVILSPAWE